MTSENFKEIKKLISEGLSTKEIAKRTGFSENTVSYVAGSDSLRDYTKKTSIKSKYALYPEKKRHDEEQITSKEAKEGNISNAIAVEKKPENIDKKRYTAQDLANVVHVNSVLQTTDYDIFRFLKGNRDVSEQRARKIRMSILRDGYIFTIIIVNEYLEIIDGQGRYVVLRELGLPIYFVIQPGLGIEDCRVLNRNTNAWKIDDYITSESKQGNENYLKLKKLCEAYRPIGISNRAIEFALCGNTSVETKIKKGTFEITEEQFQNARELLNYAAMFVPTCKKAKKGSLDNIILAVIFAANFRLADRDGMYSQFEKFFASKYTPEYSSVSSALASLSYTFNFRAKGEKVFFEHKYREFIENKIPWLGQKGDASDG